MPDDKTADIVSSLHGFLEESCGIEVAEIDDNASLQKLGMTSLDMIRFFLFVEEEYEINLTFRKLDRGVDSSLLEIATYIAKRNQG